MSNPLDTALASLRAEVRLAEEHLATLDEAPLADRLAAAGDVHAARLRVREVEVSVPASARRSRTADAVETLASLFSTEPEAEESEPSPPGMDEDPLSELFA